MNCPATQFIQDIDEQAKTMTVHTHSDGSRWVHYPTTDNEGENVEWSWLHIRSKRDQQRYSCNEKGWVLVDTPPPDETDVIVYNAEHGERYMCAWNIGFADDEQATHWMPEPELPEVAE